MTHVLVAIEHESGNVSRMQFGTSREAKQLLPDVALSNGFKLHPERKRWERDPTDEAIQKEIEKTKWVDPVKGWRRVKDGEQLPPRAEAKVVSLFPSEAAASLPEDMHSRLKDFEQRVQETVSRAQESIAISKEESGRIHDLEGRLSALENALREAMKSKGEGE